jgi:5-methyltetrahydrofolate--homocysteine methyltransferase
MAKTALEKLAIAERLHQLAVEDFSLNPCDLVIDPLTFTLASGSPETVNAGKETLEAIRLIHTKLPGTLTCLGISNISYGLSRAARAVVNSVFLYHSIQNGLDTAILNPTHIRPYPEIPDDERNLAEDLIFNSRPDALERLVAHFSGKEQLEVQTPDTAKYYPLGERIRRHILNRVKQGLEADLDEYIRTHMELGEKGAALDALNKLLLPAMKEVGELFATGELILPFVLGSAEVMQVATNHLEPYIAQDKSAQNGKIVLATVYGDVHDIGKNLVRTILSSNGYEVIDLGKQVPVERIITTAVEENADAIGLSALLVSTSQQMLHVIESLKDQNLRFPVLIGGAAVNKDFARRIAISGGTQPYAGGVHYCRDAFDALKILETYQSGSKFLPDKANSKIIVSAKPASAIPKSVSIPPQDIPHPPFWGAHILEDIPLEDLFDNLNIPALFRISWGVKNASGEKWESYKHTLGEKLAEFRRRLKQENWLGPAATYGFFPCDVQDDDLLVLQDSDPRIEAVCFHLPRQQHGAQRSLADYFLPAGLKNKDLAIFQIVTMGQRATEYIQMLQEEKGLSDAYFAHGLAVGLTEAAAKWLHARIRKELGIPKKNGKRYSWGYPQLPDLSQHEKLFQLLPARQIGITLTSAYQFVPEYTTAALVLHHTQAEYFSIEPNKRRKA